MKTNTEKVGVVKTAKQMLTIKNGEWDYTENYFIQWHRHDTRWHDVDQLSPIYEFEDSFERQLCNLMVDINLSEGNFDLVRAHFEDKQQYETE